MQLESLPSSVVAGVWSNDSNLQLEATTLFRKLLSIGKMCGVILVFLCHDDFLIMASFMITIFLSLERSPPIEEVIQSGVVPRFVEFLMREDFPQLQVKFVLKA